MLPAGESHRPLAPLPNALCVLRAAAAPVLFWGIVDGAPAGILLGVLVLAAATDVLDGPLARRLGACSPSGAYLDAVADLIVALAAFVAFTIVGVYPIWAPLLIVAAFALFVLTSGRAGLRYDPVGCYYGAFLFVAAGTTLALQDFAVAGTALAALVCLTAVTTVSRAGLLLPGPGRGRA